MIKPLQNPSLFNHYVAEFGLKDHLNEDFLRHLHLFQLDRQQELYTQTDPQRRFYLLVAGRVQVNYFHPNGKEAILAWMSPLAVIGDVELFRASPIISTIMTLEKCTFLGIERALAQQYGGDDPRFLRFLIHHLTDKLTQTSLLQTSQGLPLISRLARYCLSQGDEAVRYESKPQLAALLGSTPRHLNRVLKTLSEEGIIQINAQEIKLLKRAVLEKYAQAD